MAAEITVNKGGTGEKVIDLNTTDIPDLWHIADWLSGEAERRKNPELEKQAEMIRETWHLAHDMKRHICGW